eukprot:scaffold9388_cov148-Skeletonema_marinoi.AAC.23
MHGWLRPAGSEWPPKRILDFDFKLHACGLTITAYVTVMECTNSYRHQDLLRRIETDGAATVTTNSAVQLTVDGIKEKNR